MLRDGMLLSEYERGIVCMFLFKKEINCVAAEIDRKRERDSEW